MMSLRQQPAQEVYEPVEVNRFGEVGVAAGGEGVGAILCLVVCGQGNDEHAAGRFLRADAARGFDAVHNGEADVHQHDVRLIARGDRDGLRAIGCFEHAKTAPFEFESHQVARVLEILDDEDGQLLRVMCVCIRVRNGSKPFRRPCTPAKQRLDENRARTVFRARLVLTISPLAVNH